MFGKEYALKYTEQFDRELAAASRYIAEKLENPIAAEQLVNDVEVAILDRLAAPESFMPVMSSKFREHKYYRVDVGNFIVLYVVIGDVMEVRRFVYGHSDWK